eukprot:CAMPEP_0116870868 /NCGR_PEP_ID=MMETSP0463-20121206/972_1 /TAXON_ID=181622 /ORGANISM="Strombidinopsis sp, Strain SopsisLIS2011" /LENGTH=66 /DNA_ID=CAMNT_0004508227 /DNA_START=855 /DNA_END=1055 /DNA_ORIENTATION=-
MTSNDDKTDYQDEMNDHVDDFLALPNDPATIMKALELEKENNTILAIKDDFKYEAHHFSKNIVSAK